MVLSSEILLQLVVGAVLTAIAMFLLRDSLTGFVRYIRAKRKSEAEWFDQTVKYLQRLVQTGTNIQASSEISEEKLQEIEDTSKDFLPHVKGASRSLDEGLEDELQQIGYMSGWAANYIRDLDDATTLSELMDLQADFKRRMDADDLGFDDIVENVPDEDIGRWNQQVPQIFKQIDLDMGEQMALVMEMLEETDEVENPEDFRWDVMDNALDEESLENIIAEVKYSLISVILVEIPEDAMRRIEEVG